LQLVYEDSLFVTNSYVNWEYDNSGIDCHDIITLFKYKNMWCSRAVHFLVDSVFSVFFLCSSFYDTLIINGCIAANGCMADELERIWNKAAVAKLVFYSSICL
jgi:hypothetical protein